MMFFNCSGNFGWQFGISLTGDAGLGLGAQILSAKQTAAISFEEITAAFADIMVGFVS